MMSEPLLPDYGGACVSNLVPALLQHREIGAGWIPDEVLDADQVVLFVVDGLGWLQLQERAHLAPTLTSMTSRAITTVAPTTTSTALTSIATGATPGEHGIVGYKIRIGGEVLNVLRWSNGHGDARDHLDPEDVQPLTPFLGQRPPVISSATFSGTGFTTAHLRDTEYRGYHLPSSVSVEVGRALGEGARFVYAYYDGIDKVAHIHGLERHYAAELATVDRMVADLIDVLPSNAALLVTADHGQVQVGNALVPLDPALAPLTAQISGEARFVWLHARSGRAADLLDAARIHGDVAWVRPVEQILDEGWFGRVVGGPAAARLGDVALVAHADVGLVDPGAKTPQLQSRHGGMTEAEVLVPLLSARTS